MNQNSGCLKVLAVIGCFTITSTDAFGQETYKSAKYDYSFTMHPTWSIKDQIYTPGVDAKIVDGKGNSMIVSVNLLPLELKNISVKEMFTGVSDDDLKNEFCAAYDECIILKRGTRYIDGKEFYYIHLSDPFEEELRLVHKMFFFNYKSNAFSIDCAAISSMTNSTAPYFDLMLNSFKFK